MWCKSLRHSQWWPEVVLQEFVSSKELLFIFTITDQEVAKAIHMSRRLGLSRLQHVSGLRTFGHCTLPWWLWHTFNVVSSVKCWLLLKRFKGETTWRTTPLARKYNCDIFISTSYQVAKYKSGRTWLVSSSIECPAYDPWWEVCRAFESGILYDPAFSTGCGMIFVSSISIILSWLLLEGSGLNALKGTLNQNYLRPSRVGGRTVSKSQRYQGSSITKCRRHCLIMLVFNAHPGFDVQLLKFSKKHVSGTATSQQKSWLDHLNLSTDILSAKLSDSYSGINECARPGGP